jgi:hypothetical protein
MSDRLPKKMLGRKLIKTMEERRDVAYKCGERKVRRGESMPTDDVSL